MNSKKVRWSVSVLPGSPGWVQRDCCVSGPAGCTWQAAGSSWERPPSDESSEEGAGEMAHECRTNNQEYLKINWCKVLEYFWINRLDDAALYHSIHRHLGCRHRKSHWCWSLHRGAQQTQQWNLEISYYQNFDIISYTFELSNLSPKQKHKCLRL